MLIGRERTPPALSRSERQAPAPPEVLEELNAELHNRILARRLHIKLHIGIKSDPLILEPNISLIPEQCTALDHDAMIALVIVTRIIVRC